jgi:hypothetical protein
MKERIIEEAKGLKSEHGENEEYDRALVELIARTYSMPYRGVAEILNIDVHGAKEVDNNGN